MPINLYAFYINMTSFLSKYDVISVRETYQRREEVGIVRPIGHNFSDQEEVNNNGHLGLICQPNVHYIK